MAGRPDAAPALAALAALALAVAACSPPTGTGTATGTGTPTGASERALDCDPVGDAAPSADHVTVLGTLALPAPDGRPLQAVETPGGAGPERWFSKTGLGVRDGGRGGWRLRVAEGSVEHLRIGWGSPGEPGTTVVPASCEGAAPSSTTGWLWWPGGFWTDEPGCYGVVVEVGGRSEEVDVPVGAPCG